MSAEHPTTAGGLPEEIADAIKAHAMAHTKLGMDLELASKTNGTVDLRPYGEAGDVLNAAIIAALAAARQEGWLAAIEAAARAADADEDRSEPDNAGA